MEAAGSGAPGLRVSRPEITCLRCYCSCNCRPRCRERRRRCDCRRRSEPAPAAASLPIAERLRKARRPSCGPGAHAGGRRPVLCWAWAGSPPHGRGREAQALAAGSESVRGGPGGAGLRAHACSGARGPSCAYGPRAMRVPGHGADGGPRSWSRTRLHSRVTDKYPSPSRSHGSTADSRTDSSRVILDSPGPGPATRVRARPGRPVPDPFLGLSFGPITETCRSRPRCGHVG